jgi:hypothetical protein
LVGTGPLNRGEPGDYRVRDRAYHRGLSIPTFIPTAAIVVDVVPPDDDTYEKFGFYTAHGADELIVADPAARTLTYSAHGAPYGEVPAAALLGVTAQWLRDSIDWP